MNRGSLLRVAQVTTDARGTLVAEEQEFPSFGTAPEALLQGFAQWPNDVEVHVISCVPGPVRAPEKLAENVFFHSLVVPKIGWRALFAGCALAVRRKIRQLSPDIVHGQGTERDCALDAVFSGRPNILTIHGNMQRIARLGKARRFSYPWIVARLERFAVPRTSGVICLTRHTETEVAPLARRRWLLPNPVDRKFFSVINQPVSPPVAVCIATITALKNQNGLIRALDRIGGKNGLIVAFYGSNSGDACWNEFSQLLKSRPWCQYRGFAQRSELGRILSDATMLILPSLEENCPMVILEAMAAGVPVVASRVGGVPEVVEDGVTGLLFEPHDSASICGAVQQLVENPAMRESMARRSRAVAMQRFEPGVIARRHLEIYQEVLGRALG